MLIPPVKNLGSPAVSGRKKAYLCPGGYRYARYGGCARDVFVSVAGIAVLHGDFVRSFPLEAVTNGGIIYYAS